MEERHPKLTRHIQRRYSTLEELSVAADAVKSLEGHPGWLVVQEILGVESELIESALDDSQPITQAEYAYAHGRKGGLKAALKVVDLIRERHASEHARQAAKHEKPEDAESSSER